MFKVLVQMGHNPPRQPGFESGTGTPGEIQFVHDVGVALKALLDADDRFSVILCPGKMPEPSPTVHVALFLHADGAASSAASGYSFGWPPSEYGPKTRRLLGMLDDAYRVLPGHPPHHKDNYTKDMQGYYGFHHCTADAKVLIEHGFLTNPTERAWLTGHEKQIAYAWYVALCNYFSISLHTDQDQGKVHTRDGGPVAHPTTAAQRALYNRWELWYLGEGDEFKDYSPHDPRVRPKEWDWAAPREWLARLLDRLIQDRERLKEAP